MILSLDKSGKTVHISFETGEQIAHAVEYLQRGNDANAPVADQNRDHKIGNILMRAVDAQLSAEGWADPVAARELVANEVAAFIEAKAALVKRLKDLRATPIAYYSPKVLRFADYQPPLTYAPHNLSRDAD